MQKRLHEKFRCPPLPGLLPCRIQGLFLPLSPVVGLPQSAFPRVGETLLRCRVRRGEHPTHRGADLPYPPSEMAAEA